MRIIANNIEVTLKIILKYFNIEYRENIFNELQEHPNYPSLTAFEHVINKEGVESLSMIIPFDKLKNQLPKPVLVHVATNTDLFLVVNRINEENVFVLDERGQEVLESINNFLSMWSGVAMIFNKDNIKPPKVDISDKIGNYLDIFKKPFILFAILFIISYLFISNFEIRNALNILFILGSFIGLILSVLLILQGLDEHNPILRRICNPGAKMSMGCDTILNSKAAYFLRLFSWSEIGMIYFLVTFLINLVFPSSAMLSITIFTSLMAFPYVFYSLIYQKFIARSWCRLCLGVQVVIVYQFIVSILNISALNFKNFFLLKEGVTFFSIFLGSIVSFVMIKPLIKSFYELKIIKSRYVWLKHNQGVKQLLIESRPKVKVSEKVSLVCGNYEGETTVTLVISPVCNPCMKELSVLLPIFISKNSTRVEFIFLTDKEEVSSHEYNLALGLIESYLEEPKDFMVKLLSYVNHYPASKYRVQMFKSELRTKAEKLFEDQIEWCVANKIYSTPQIFINNSELHWTYTSKDIEYMCT